jgi:hypothetical protein
MLTINQAVALVDGVSENHIRQACKSGALPCRMAGKKYMINQDVLLEFLKGETGVKSE